MAGYFNRDKAAFSGWDALDQTDFLVYPPYSSQCSVDPDFYGCSGLPWDHQPDTPADNPSVSVELSDCLMAGDSWHNQPQAGDEIEVDVRNEKKKSQNRAAQRAFRRQYSATPASFFAAETSNEIPVELTSNALETKAEREKRSSSSNSDVEKEIMTNMHARRRAQNCASQRAFRERKEKYVKSLEHHLEELHGKHQSLLQSYTKQAADILRLDSCVAELFTELTALRQYQNSTFSDLIVLDKSDEFDAFSLTDTIYNTSDTYYDKSTRDPNFELALHSFEHSL